MKFQKEEVMTREESWVSLKVRSWKRPIEKGGGLRKQGCNGIELPWGSFVGRCSDGLSVERGTNLGKTELSWIGRRVWGRVGLFGGLLEAHTLEGRGDVH